VDQLNQILQTLGTPSDHTLSRIGSSRAQEYIRNLPRMQKRPFAKIFPNANTLAIDLLERLLTFDPAQRITVEEALEHPYLAVWHEPNDEPVCAKTFDFSSFESVDDPQQMREMIVKEVVNFRALIRHHHVPHLSLGNRQSSSASLSKIPDRDTILNSPTAVRGDVDALVAPYVPPGLHKGIGISEDLERDLSGAMDMT
ncbi:3970_t:CDS:2, partial [Racocetra persica]